jgi:hypothetical protein
LAPTAGDRLCRETKPCPRPSSDGTSPPRTPAQTTHDKGGLFGNVDLECCHAAHLKAHANAYAERFVRSIKESCLERLIFVRGKFVTNSLSELHSSLQLRFILPTSLCD